MTAFYITEWIFLAVRYFMGERMDAAQVIRYALGIQLANSNAWYAVVIPFFYLLFYLAFRCCRRRGTALAWVLLGTLGYTVLGAMIDHNNYWMRGEWWYNSILLFPLGMLVCRAEKPLLRFIRKAYPVLLPLALFGVAAGYWLSTAAANIWGYYGENWNDPMKLVHRLGTCAAQWGACLMYVSAAVLLLQKVSIGNRLLSCLGTVTLEFYLIHGLFVELFGYDFMELTSSIVYIRDIPAYVLTVLYCSAAATALLRMVMKPVYRLSGGRRC